MLANKLVEATENTQQVENRTSRIVLKRFENLSLGDSTPKNPPCQSESKQLDFAFTGNLDTRKCFILLAHYKTAWYRKDGWQTSIANFLISKGDYITDTETLIPCFAQADDLLHAGYTLVIPSPDTKYYAPKAFRKDRSALCNPPKVVRFRFKRIKPVREIVFGI